MGKRKLFTTSGLAIAAVAGLASPASAADGPYPVENWGMLHVQRRCLDLPGTGSGTAGDPVLASNCDESANDNQQWWFMRSGTDPNGQQLFSITNNKGSGGNLLCMDLAGDGPGAKVILNPCAENTSQYWRPEYKFPFYKRNWYWIRNVQTGLCLEIPGVKDAPDGTQLDVQPCESNDDHEWAIGYWWSKSI